MDILNYAMNPAKTDGSKYVSTYECQPQTAIMEFLTSKRIYKQATGGRYEKKDENVISYMIRQSFAPGEITPEEANRIGYELGLALTKGKHQFVVGTHIDKGHIHNHVIFNSTDVECAHKFDNFKDSAFVVRDLSDKLCRENDLSVVEEPADKGMHYGDWKKEHKKDWPGKLRQKIDELIPKSASFDDFIEKMKVAGYEVKLGKTLRFRAPGQKRHTIARASTLGPEYTPESITGRIQAQNQPETTPFEVPVLDDSAVRRLIDIENNERVKSSAAYTDWAAVFNVRESAKTVNYLSEKGISDYDTLAAMVMDAAAAFMETSGKIKDAEKKIAELSALRTHIVNYASTKEIYTQYRKAKRNKQKIYDANESKILLHKAAKRAFAALGTNKLPKAAEIKKDIRALTGEKKELYQVYHQQKAELQELQSVR